MAGRDVPIAAVFHLPSWAFREPRLGLFDGIREGVDVRGERRGGRRVDAGDVVIRARLRSEQGGGLLGSGRGNGNKDGRESLALTSRWPARPLLLTTWQRSGGPSSRNVAESVCVSEMDG